MGVTVEEKGLVRTLTIEEKGEQIKNLVDSVIKELQKNVNIPGFRKGHVPASVIKARYKSAVKEEVARKFIGEKLQKILEEQNLQPVSTDITFGDIELQGDQLKFKVAFEVAPEFELQPYEGLEIETIKHEITEEDIQNYIDRLLEEHAEWEPADKKIEEGDMIKIHYHIKADTGEEEEDEFEVVVGTGQLRPEIEEQIKGKKAGDEVTVENVSLYDEKGEEFGKATVTVKILEVKKKKLPKFDDEFVKKVGLGENVEEAKEKIKEQIQNQIKIAKEQEINQKIIDKLASQYEFEVPTSLVKAELEYLVQDYARQLENYGIKPNRDMLAAAAQGLEDTAVKNVRVMFVINKIAEKEGIKVEEEEINREIEEMAKLYNTTPQQLRKTLEEQGLINNIVYSLLKKKVLDFLREKANITELTKEEYEEKVKKEQEKEKGEEKKEEQ
ncbi:trigger factor [Persephonella atlantica]|uniref:Trigger factor n=1 Tax=Persephonella atlantica TaxID=2699429 RepID=A0ABS1GH25_9AQUI|nr:trigger factor [Persephonella atlantica]MBK3332236.1 trigger factor [Persephonella atlantica]